jgi:hypothetical protein
MQRHQTLMRAAHLLHQHISIGRISSLESLTCRCSAATFVPELAAAGVRTRGAAAGVAAPGWAAWPFIREAHHYLSPPSSHSLSFAHCSLLFDSEQSTIAKAPVTSTTITTRLKKDLVSY